MLKLSWARWSPAYDVHGESWIALILVLKVILADGDVLTVETSSQRMQNTSLSYSVSSFSGLPVMSRIKGTNGKPKHVESLAQQELGIA